MQELRFTRSGQAALFAALGGVCLLIAGYLALLGLPLWGKPDPQPLATPWWGLAPLPAVAVCWWAAVWMARHAFLIFTPAGLEIYPLFRRHMDLIAWSEVGALEVDSRRMLVLTLAHRENAKVFISTAPLSHRARALLAQAAAGMKGKLGAER